MKFRRWKHSRLLRVVLFSSGKCFKPFCVAWENSPEMFKYLVRFCDFEKGRRFLNLQWVWSVPFEECLVLIVYLFLVCGRDDLVWALSRGAPSYVRTPFPRPGSSQPPAAAAAVGKITSRTTSIHNTYIYIYTLIFLIHEAFDVIAYLFIFISNNNRTTIIFVGFRLLLTLIVISLLLSNYIFVLQIKIFSFLFYLYNSSLYIYNTFIQICTEFPVF